MSLPKRSTLEFLADQFFADNILVDVFVAQSYTIANQPSVLWWQTLQASDKIKVGKTYKLIVVLKNQSQRAFFEDIFLDINQSEAHLAGLSLQYEDSTPAVGMSLKVGTLDPMFQRIRQVTFYFKVSQNTTAETVVKNIRLALSGTIVPKAFYDLVTPPINPKAEIPALQIASNQHDFEALMAGNSASVNLQLKSTGEESLWIEQIAMEGDAAFSLVTPIKTPLLIQKDSSKEITVQVHGLSAGQKFGQLIVRSNDPLNPVQKIGFKVKVLPKPA